MNRFLISLLGSLVAVVNVQAELSGDGGSNKKTALSSDVAAYQKERNLRYFSGVKEAYIPSTPNIDLFESELKTFSGSYAIYDSLSAHQKEKVYGKLKKGAAINIVRNQIIDVRLGRF